MAITINGGNGGARSRRRAYSGAISEINVTPFVDVMLVLLIIFMLTAHVMEFGIEVDVPKTRMVKDSAKELPVVNITKDGTLYLNEKEVNIHELDAEIGRRFHGATAVYLRADKETIWEPIAEVMSELGAAKLQVNAVTQPEDLANKRRK
ncbi:MAG TPA: biopolymer transporter ExbD [Bryobacteraceae bacterium]|nr:biopolymer transporter ExbD [Bryobacteraceae bacterium]